MALWSIRRWMLVIAVSALLFGGILETGRMQPARQGFGRRTQCASNLRNVVLATLGYANQQGHLPTGTWPNPGLPPEKRLSWYAASLPYLDCPDLWNQLDKDRAWDDAANEAVATTVIGYLRCPDHAG